MAFDLLTPAFAEERATALLIYILRGIVEALSKPLYEISWENHLLSGVRPDTTVFRLKKFTPLGT